MTLKQVNRQMGSYLLSGPVIKMIVFLLINVSSSVFIPPEGLKEETKRLLSSSSKKKGKSGAKNEPTKEEEIKADSQPITIHLNFKRYVYDPHKKMVQS